ncbi:MAG: hypothetical protein LBI70_02020 [Rickettsiales bacterium]|nr:hypothetical protein [Rickettsiales bacterium]
MGARENLSRIEEELTSWSGTPVSSIRSVEIGSVVDGPREFQENSPI